MTSVKDSGMLQIKRYFSTEGKSPYSEYDWTKSDQYIIDSEGNHLFTQKNVEFPSHFSPLATKIITSRYFYGENGSAERESSLRTLIERITSTISNWGIKDGYFDESNKELFKDELAILCLEQAVAWNSPVWFNVGTQDYKSRKSGDRKDFYIIQDKKAIQVPLGEDHKYPQTSACFIQKVGDTMEDIMMLAYFEAMLFKFGSGTGTDLSTLRSTKEKLSGGGKPSGPLAYLRFYNKVAEIVQSGGKTRRAAKMNSMKDWHPDILEFIEAKNIEEDKIRALMKQGYSWKDASKTVDFQNTNLSVRLSDEFMSAVLEDRMWKTKPVHNQEIADDMPEYKARFLMDKLSHCTWSCGDPGVQFDSTINNWNTCANSFWINASNPCSEYMFIDNSSCNLASHNLRAYQKDDGTFDIEKFEQAIKLLVFSQDLLYNNSSFPRKEIAQNSYDYRPLGQGYANAGSLIMSLGLPYNSDEARNLMASITALMTGVVYKTSTELAEKIGTFDKYNENKEPMMKVMKKHRNALKKINESKIPKGLENILHRAREVWDIVIERGEEYGFRNAQATALAPTGTIGFMMDCDTKGIEPEIGLVQTKLLAEGGVLRMVNQTVPIALNRLGYSEQEIVDIVEYISGKGYNKISSTPYLKEEHKKNLESKLNFSENREKTLIEDFRYEPKKAKEIIFYLYGHETIEGAPHIKDEHLSVFDCATKPYYGERTISYQGHIDMMAAVQPFISGGISKTINCPSETTEEDIQKAYFDAWRKGLKSLTLYRDGSKASQVLSFSEGLEDKIKVPVPVRRRLLTTRKSVTHKFSMAGGIVEQNGEQIPITYEGYLTAGLFPEGDPGELFITMSKEGSTLGGLMDVIGTLTSMALQYGVPLKVLVDKFQHQRFEPHGIVYEGHPEIGTADSLIDYIYRWMGKEFLRNGNKNDSTNKTKLVTYNKNSPIVSDTTNLKTTFKGELGGICPVCQKRMIRSPKGCEQRCITPSCNFVDTTGCG